MDQIAAVVADSLLQTNVAAEADKGRGRAVDACMVVRRTAWNTTNDYPDRFGKVSERRAGGTQVDSHGLGRIEEKGSRNVEVVEKSTTSNGSLGSWRNGVDQMSQEGEGIYAHVVGMERDAGTAGLKRKNLAAVDACK